MQPGVDAPLVLDYSEDSIDAAVLSELPASIQREIRLSIMSSRPATKRQLPNTSKGMHKFFKPRT